MCIGPGVGQIIDDRYFKRLRVSLEHGAQRLSPDAAETIDTQPSSHPCNLQLRKCQRWGGARAVPAGVQGATVVGAPCTLSSCNDAGSVLWAATAIRPYWTKSVVTT